MDVEKNPGPVVNTDNLTDALGEQNTISYNKNELVELREEAIKPLSDVLEALKINKIFKYRGSCAGKSRDIYGKRIPVVSGRRITDQSFRSASKN